MPSDETAKSLMPMSIPITEPVLGKAATSASVQHKDTKYLPLGLRDTVAERILPFTSLEIRHFTAPSFGSCMALSNTLIFVPTHLLL